SWRERRRCDGPGFWPSGSRCVGRSCARPRKPGFQGFDSRERKPLMESTNIQPPFDGLLQGMDRFRPTGTDDFFRFTAKKLIRTICEGQLSRFGQIDLETLLAILMSGCWQFEAPWSEMAAETRESIGAKALNYVEAVAMERLK